MHFDNLSKFFQYLGITPPNHPLFALVDLSKEAKHWRPSSPAITTDFYAFALKHILAGDFHYGRTKFDFQEGVMVFTQPGQSMEWTEMEMIEKGYYVVLHKDFLENTFLEHKLKSYAFFSYTVNEALHLSHQEEELLLDVLQKLEHEYRNVYDPYNKDILLSYVGTVLSYAQRFYNRQFAHRKPVHDDLTERFYLALHTYRKEKDVTPTVAALAQDMCLSPKYLSDLLKATTGKTALEHIHLAVLEEAKDILLHSDKTVSEIAYGLGFEYPQYFTRLFKNKVGMSPVEFRKQHLN